ncbi:putative reverse transcriptase domain-containing protein [Tanacetum coccineum]
MVAEKDEYLRKPLSKWIHRMMIQRKWTFDYNRSSLEPQCQMSLLHNSSSLKPLCQKDFEQNGSSLHHRVNRSSSAAETVTNVQKSWICYSVLCSTNISMEKIKLFKVFRSDEYAYSVLVMVPGMDQRDTPILCEHLEESEVRSICGSGNDENPDIAAIITQQLHNIIPLIVTSNNNVNNANANGGNGGNGNGGNNGCSYKAFLACNPRDYDGKGGAVALTRWIEKMESVIARGREAAIGMTWDEFKALLVEEFCPSNKMRELVGVNFESIYHLGIFHAGYTDRFHELAKLVPHLVTPESKRIRRYINGLAPQIRRMLQATQPTTIQSAILKAGILTDEAVRCDNKKAKVGKGFVATAPPRNENVGSYPKCAKCSAYHPESGPCRLCFNCQKPGHFARDCRAPVRLVTPVSAVRMGNNQRVCYECGSSEHLRNTCPKLNRAPGQAGNRLALEGNRNTQNNGNQARGRAFNVNAVDALQDPNIVTGEIVCHEKVVRIPLEGGEILRVQGERTLGGTKTLMSTKADEPELSDIPIV